MLNAREHNVGTARNYVISVGQYLPATIVDVESLCAYFTRAHNTM